MIASILGWATVKLSRRARAREAYRRAHEAHWSAVKRGDTRRIHETRLALLAAQAGRLKVGA